MNIVEKLLRRPTDEQPIVGGFIPEAKAGLKEIGHKFFCAIQAYSIDQLIANGIIAEDYVIFPSSGKDKEVISLVTGFVPVAREVAIDPSHYLLSKTYELSLDDQLEETEKYARRLRRINLKHGSLETVDFTLTNASVHVQLDWAYQKKSRKPLYVPDGSQDALFISTIDKTGDPKYAGFVGRVNHRFLWEVQPSDLGVSVFLCNEPAGKNIYAALHPGYGGTWASPVAQPKQIDTQVPPIFYT